MILMYKQMNFMDTNRNRPLLCNCTDTKRFITIPFQR